MKKTKFSFQPYINKLLKSILLEKKLEEDSFCLSLNTKQQLDSFLKQFLEFIIHKLVKFTEYSEKLTIYDKEIFNFISLFLRPFQNQIVSFIHKSKENFDSDTTKHNLKQDKACISFPPCLCEKRFRTLAKGYFLSKYITLYTACILEFLCYTILSGSLNTLLYTENNTGNRTRILVKDIELFILSSKEFQSIIRRTNNISFVGGTIKTNTVRNDTTKNENETNISPKLSQTIETRVKKGTIVTQQIARYQKTSNILFCSKLPFRKLVRNLVKRNLDKFSKDFNLQQEIKISNKVFILLQHYIEQFIVDFLIDSYSLSLHSGRNKLIPHDIFLLSHLRKYNYFVGISTKE